MGLETGTYISDLNAANPVGGTDLVSTLDDHIRLVKSTIKATFPSVAGAVSATDVELSYVHGVTSAIQTQINAKAPIASPTFTGNPTAPTPATADNSQSIATTAQVQAAILAASLSGTLPNQTGNAGKFITTNGTTASWATTTISKSFTSAEQTITKAGALTIAHGLGVIPLIVTGYLKCTSAELNYSIGDVLCVPLGQNYVGVADYGVSVVPDSTNLNIRFGAQGFGILNKTTGTAFGITPASWTFSLRAIA